MNKLKIISAIIAAILVVNFIFLIIVPGYMLWFWIIIILSALFAYKIIPRIKK